MRFSVYFTWLVGLGASVILAACASDLPIPAGQAAEPTTVTKTESAAWQEAEIAASAAYKAYLDSYPKGRHVIAALTKLNAIQNAEVPVDAATGRLPPGEVFRDCADCPEMVVIPAGNFQMGSPGDEAGRFEGEAPLHAVTIRQDFALGKTHITRGQFALFVKATGHDAGDKCYTFEDGKYLERSGRSWRDPGFPQQDTHPAVCLNWSDARAYAEWLSKKTDKTYRLPSEAEWEYSARAGTRTARYWGDSPDQACGYANVMDSTGKASVPGVTWDVHDCSDGHAYTSPAASFKPNSFGLYDMIGNAWEWTEDCWNDNYAGAPAGGSAWTKGACLQRVLRGGSWYYTPRYARSATRYRFVFSFRNYIYGFRLARTLP